jgi:ferritin
MLSDIVLKALNKQVNEELYSWYVYRAMANHFEQIALKGFANWFNQQALEELDHANRLMGYIQARGASVELSDIKAPPSTWESPLAAMEAAYKHECHISACINNLANLSVKEGDQTTATFLIWFITEQVEEEALVDGIVQQLRYVKDSPAAIFMMDREIGASRAAESGSSAS